MVFFQKKIGPWAGLGWAGPGWAGLGWAGLGWAKPSPSGALVCINDDFILAHDSLYISRCLSMDDLTPGRNSIIQ
jgi:hypothetical protein